MRRMVKKRSAAHAGSFYPGKKEDLVKTIEWSFMHEIGPGRLPIARNREKSSVAYMVPHAGYIYSGPVAAHSYMKIAEGGKPSVFVIAGPNHTGLGENASIWKEGYWETPLGEVEVDSEVSKLLVENTRYFSFDENAHLYEHSVEVQIPFLQYIFGEIKVVPIVIKLQNPEVSRDLGEALYKISKENGVDLVYIASSDMNHYDPHEETLKKDEIALKEIEELDLDGLYKALEKYGISMCGPGPVGAMLTLGKRLAYRCKILKHATSGDMTGEKNWVVGYASAMLHKGDSQ